MRLTPTRILQALCLVMLLLLMAAVLRQSNNRVYTETCYTTNDFQKELHTLGGEVHHVLDTLQLLHWLCFGSLWGQLRRSAILPWDQQITFCLRNDQLTTYDELFLIRRFASHGLTLSYDSSEGQYEVHNDHIPKASVALVVFEEGPGQTKNEKILRRVGWKRRLLPPDCELSPSLQCMPAQLVSPPLPQKEFGTHLLPVPREGIEVQKYHYPDDWWKEVTPKNC